MRRLNQSGTVFGRAVRIQYDTMRRVTRYEVNKVQTMPTTVLVARDGTMRFIHHGYKPGYEADYQNQVRTLLRE